ncbi:hypothetical protein LTR53_002738 [Teratosphaeriaceae sp. CCFEE 6253]|nr:hypothetical protein LTR53_002738 [Teratosphaeriaceae sp. CCFEE 6253]
MRLVERFWTTVTYVVNIFVSPPLGGGDGITFQAPLLGPSDAAHKLSYTGPIFKPPGGSLTGPGSDFVCDYSAMKGWTDCSTPDNRGCWLRQQASGKEIGIYTDYEDPSQTPVGIHRTYYMNITGDNHMNADGLDFPNAKQFNNTYPGPWIQACWGDNVTIIVTNEMPFNGTSVHWHGIRQLLTMHMDGVNGVTQCPIAPGSTFNYTWQALQYGSSWYHSHYSVQYADGAAGPLTLHGPASAPYDEPKTPLLMTDWGHNSAFNAITDGLHNKSILLNGIGNITRYNNATTPSPLQVPDPYTLTFAPPILGRAKRYLLRLINVSFESTFVFSIDNHMLQIIGSDFVPILPYPNTSVLVGIGQRYQVVVEAKPIGFGLGPAPKEYWIRTWKANCFRFNQSQAGGGYERTGILRYDDSQDTPSTTSWPLYTNVSLNCSDETYSSLQPIVEWTVPKNPINDPSGNIGENLTVQLNRSPDFRFPLALFSMGGEEFNPLMIDYGNPTFLHLNYTGKWPPLWVVYPENYQSTDWVYMVLKGKGSAPGNTIGAHPIHLHGHDFAILQQIANATFPAQLNLTLHNPPRRDVVLLPTDGYAVIAFKTDNPGSWLMHCHIADHASFGLALQVMERQAAAQAIWPWVNASHALQAAQTGCNEWNKWWWVFCISPGCSVALLTRVDV